MTFADQFAAVTSSHEWEPGALLAAVKSCHTEAARNVYRALYGESQLPAHIGVMPSRNDRAGMQRKAKARRTLEERRDMRGAA